MFRTLYYYYYYDDDDQLGKLLLTMDSAGFGDRIEDDVLALECVQLQGERAQELARMLPQWPTLKTLRLFGNKIGEEGACAIAASLPRTQLSRLLMAANGVGPKGARALAGFGAHLVVLELQYNDLFEADWTAIADALTHTRLTHLNLGYCALGDCGAAVLAAAVPRTRLLDLNLCGNGIGDVAMSAFAAALPRARLTNLNLVANRLSGQGACVLVAVLAHTALKKLAINQRQDFDEETRQAFVAVLPHTQLVALDVVYNMHASLDWRRAVASAGVWTEEQHAVFPAPIRAILASLLIIACSTREETCARSHGLSGLRGRVALRELFRWIAQLNYFEPVPIS